eukprot:TRINITY_DN3829_c0_g2_i3.p1 TRINITY_DN3829_c0_g2~~TRINITY_DN3829_c0_g2_i3.p1  ORF type:complete len:385 (-),score=54.05 TRINITY_DN3829_c0_g2_i3:1047-2201(-)
MQPQPTGRPSTSPTIPTPKLQATVATNTVPCAHLIAHTSPRNRDAAAHLVEPSSALAPPSPMKRDRAPPPPPPPPLKADRAKNPNRSGGHNYVPNHWSSQASVSNSVLSFGINMFKMWILIVIFGVLYWQYMKLKQQAQMPFAALQSFALQQEKRQLNDKDIGDVPIEQMKIFSSAACVQGEFQAVQKALDKQLGNVPKDVRETVIDQCLVEGVSVQNSRQDATMDVETGAKAHAYLTFWSTEYINSPISQPEYSSCVMVTGIELSVAEELAGWEVSTDYKTVGYEDCHCRLFGCKKCPIIKEITSKKPIFKRHQITLNEHKQLHKEMVGMAVQQVKDLSGRKGELDKPWWSMVPMLANAASEEQPMSLPEDSTWDLHQDLFVA